MNVNNLKVKLIVKNYKEMCSLLDEKERGGNAKKYQMENWKRFFDWNMSGHKFIITEIYDKPKEIIVQHGGIRNYMLLDYIERLICNLLIQERHNGQVVASKHALFVLLHLANENYKECKQYIPKLSRYMDISENDIYEFYHSAGDVLKRSLENGLNSLKSKKIIFWSHVMMVCITDGEVVKNELNRPKVNKYHKGKDKYDNDKYEYKTIGRNVKPSYREATDLEYKLIMKIEGEVLDEMGYKNEREVVFMGKWVEYKKRVNEILEEKANIYFSYEAYKIRLNEERLESEWERINAIEIEFTKDKMNNQIVSRLRNNTDKRNKRATEEAAKWWGEIPDKKLVRRSSEDYVDNHNKLIDTLIDHTYKSVHEEVKTLKLEKESDLKE